MGYRLMVGQQFLELLIEVRALVPQQSKYYTESAAYLSLCFDGVQEVNCFTSVRARIRGREVFCFEYSQN